MEATELAFRIGRSSAALSRYESGKAEPPMRVARRLAEVLGLTLDELFSTATPTTPEEVAA